MLEAVLVWVSALIHTLIAFLSLSHSGLFRHIAVFIAVTGPNTTRTADTANLSLNLSLLTMSGKTHQT